MAKDYPEVVQRGLKLKKIGNELVTLVGGREIHPINVRVGGFYRVPKKQELARLVEPLKWAKDVASEIVRWVGTLPFPEFEQDYEFVAMRHPDEYPFTEGRLISNKGLDIAVQEYDQHFAEEHVAHSNALHCVLKERGAYHVGPLARYNLNFDLLPSICQEAARSAGLGSVCKNPFQSIIVRSVEVLYACEEALRIIDQYEMPEEPAVEAEPRAGVGYGCSEAPRGILVHRYRVDERGLIQDARIIPPTSQNQKVMESDLHEFVTKYLALPQDKLTWQCEQAIRNYDPCISCATHFLKVKIQRD
jgi:coenzyme F420-reducing hydrogenase alpha subunit